MEAIGKYQVIRVPDRAPNDGNILRPDLVEIIEGLLEKGVRHVAICFEETTSLPRSRQISILVRCVKLMQERRGRLAIIAPDAGLRSLFAELGLAGIVSMYSSGDDLLRETVGNE